MEYPCASASRPRASCTAARVDHAAHQSFHVPMAAVTSSKSVSTMPLATKRGAQCAIAEATSSSRGAGFCIVRVSFRLLFDTSRAECAFVAAATIVSEDSSSFPEYFRCLNPRKGYLEVEPVKSSSINNSSSTYLQ